MGRKHLTSDSEVLTKDLALSNSESFCAANSFQFNFTKELTTNRSEWTNKTNPGGSQGVTEWLDEYEYDLKHLHSITFSLAKKNSLFSAF